MPDGHTSQDERFMRQALALALRGRGFTSPNPMVGAVVVGNGRVIGQGFHRRAGLAHAEAQALRRAGKSARGATLYVTLEPCNHTGRTPPCCDAILAAGIKRVVAAAQDPNPLVSGRGLARLRRAGVRVTTGVLAEATKRLNAPFWKTMTHGLPWVVAKVGQSLDGKIATVSGESRWITSAASREVTHRLRAVVDAILVGSRTVRADDPLLSARGVRHRAGFPVKVLLEGSRALPAKMRCLSARSPAPVWIATTRTQSRRAPASAAAPAEVLFFPSKHGRVPLRRLLQELSRRGIQSVLIEGGGEVLGEAFAAKLIDHVVWFTAPLIIGGRTAPSSVSGEGVKRLSQAARLTGVTYSRLGVDLCLEADVEYAGVRYPKS